MTIQQIACTALAILALSGCAENRQASTDAKRTLLRDTTEVRQALTPDGKAVQLTTKTRTTERETSATEEQSRVEIEQPKILQDFGAIAKALAMSAAGPAGGAAVDWLWQLVSGTCAAGTLAGAGVVMRQRAIRRRMVKAQDDYASDIEQADTDEEVAAIKTKHAERQKALGIHAQLTKERHRA